MKKFNLTNPKKMMRNWKALSFHLKISYALFIFLFTTYAVIELGGFQDYSIGLAMFALIYPVITILDNLFLPDDSSSRRFLVCSCFSLVLTWIAACIYSHIPQEKMCPILQAGNFENNAASIAPIIIIIANIIESIIYEGPEKIGS